MRFLLVAALVLAAAGCTDDSGSDCICTAVFETIDMQVVDGAGNPVTGLASVTTFLDTNEELRLDPPDNPGSYTIINDSQSRRIAVEGEGVRFDVTASDGRTASAQLIVDTDDCHCHVHRSAGPTMIVLPDAP